MKLIKTFLKTTAVWLSVLTLSSVLGTLYNFTQLPAVQASQDGIHVTVQGTGVSGAFTLSSQAGVWDNSNNPIPIPANGQVGFSISWEPVDPFSPTSCLAKTQTVRYDNNLYDSNQNGSGFLYPAATNLPIVESNYQVTGTLVPFDTSRRRVYVECDDTVHNTYYWYAFVLTFRATNGITGDCLPGYAFSTGSYSQNSQVFTVGGAFGSDMLGNSASYARDDGGTGFVCSEIPSTIEPEAFCGRRCKMYNPALSRPQNNGGWYTVCENENVSGGTPPPEKQPIYTQFETWVDGPTSNNLNLTTGATLPFNVNFSGTGGGLSQTSIRVGSWLGSFTNDHFGSPSFWSGWVFNSGMQSRREDLNWADNIFYGGTTAGVSYRPSNNCRVASGTTAPSITDSGSVTNEQYAYFEQQYRRDGQRGSGNQQQRLWGPELKVLYPFIQTETPNIGVQITGGVEGTDYTIDRSNGSPNNPYDPQLIIHNSVHFLRNGTYQVHLTQAPFTSAIMICQVTPDPNQYQFKNLPYNCGPNATRIQQFKGMTYPAMSIAYNVKVTDNGGGTTPNAQLTINGVTADANNPNRVTVVSPLSAGPNADPVTLTLPASWGASNVPANSCSVTRENPANGITVTTNPWRDQQTGLPIGNPSAPLGFGNILRGASTDTRFTLTCGVNGQQVTRSIRVQLSRDGSAPPPAALSLTVMDPRYNQSVVADANNPTNTGELQPFDAVLPANIQVSWQGNTGLYDNQCTVNPVQGAPNTLGVTGEPWHSGAGNQAVSGGPTTLSITGLDPGTSGQLHFVVTCRQLSDGSNMTRDLTVTVHRANVPPPPHSISGTVRFTDNSPAVNYTMDIGGGVTVNTDTNGYYIFSNLSDGPYTVTVTPGNGESCQNSCSQSRTLAGSNITGVDFILQSNSGGGGQNGSVLNRGTGSRQWSQ